MAVDRELGLVFLIVTTLLSIAGVVYLLTYLTPHKDVSDAAIPIIIFVLALFAISPAVLLLRERPLKGLDEWSPSAGTHDSAKTSSSTGDSKTSSSQDGAATKQPTTSGSKPV